MGTECGLDALRTIAPPGSGALRAYLRQLYDGGVSLRDESQWRWAEADVIWLELLPLAAQQCVIPGTRVYPVRTRVFSGNYPVFKPIASRLSPLTRRTPV